MADLVVEIRQGKLRGTTAKDYYGGEFFKFLGIPYAKPPIGELRFKPPQPPEPWSGVRNATKEGPECPALDMYFLYFIGNEDNCLNLNVYTKELPSDDNEALKKPVMVWIHGGGFVSGSNKSELYGPDYLMTQDIVLVIINYRLGIFGFASFQDPELEVAGNAGLKDMRMALQWVQENIETFGGDPCNVTIFGESAGSASVHYLTLTPTTEGLFHKAIMQSGCTLNTWAWGKTNSHDIAKFMGYKDIDEKQIFDKLKRESAKNIVNAQKKAKETFSVGIIRPWGPVVEPPSPHAILTEHPSSIMQSKGGHKIPLIIGYNSGEGIFFELVRRTVPGVNIPLDLENEIPYDLEVERGGEKSKEVVNKLRKAYFGDSNENDIHQIYKLKGDSYFIHSIQRALKLQSKHSQEPIYAYRMSLISSLNYFHKLAMTKYFKTTILCCFLSKLSLNYLSSVRGSLLNLINKFPLKEMDGVVHADDLLYLFPTFYTLPIKKGSPEDLYIQRFVRMWTNFARNGHPTPEDDEVLNNVKWAPIRQEKIELLDIGQELQMIGNVDEERLKVWDEIYEAHSRV